VGSHPATAILCANASFMLYEAFHIRLGALLGCEVWGMSRCPRVCACPHFPFPCRASHARG